MQENSGNSRGRKPYGENRRPNGSQGRRDGAHRNSGDFRERKDRVDGEKREYRGRRDDTDERNDRPRRDREDRYGNKDRGWKPAGAPGWKKDDRRARDRFDRYEDGGRRRSDRSDWRKPNKEESFKQVRRDPELEFPEDLQLSDLDSQVRASLKALSKENADEVAKHLVMVQNLMDINPELAHKHALAAFSRAARLGVIRETLAMTAYAVGDFALALKELQAFKRISGSNEYIGIMVDSERGMGRPEKALQLGRSVDQDTLSREAKANLAVAMSGARLDLGDAEGALLELEIPELNPKDAHPWSVGLFGAYAEVLSELGREAESAKWRKIAEKTYEVFFGVDEVVEIEEVEVETADVEQEENE